MDLTYLLLAALQFACAFVCGVSVTLAYLNYSQHKAAEAERAQRLLNAKPPKPIPRPRKK